MYETYPGPGKLEKEQDWYAKRILEAIESNQLSTVIETMIRAIDSGYKISDINFDIVDDDIKDESIILPHLLENFFTELILEDKLSVDQRIQLYKKFLEKDYEFASTFIDRARPGSDEPYDVMDNIRLNPEELYEVQEKHYEWLVDHTDDIQELALCLEVDGHLDHTAYYNIDKSIKDKIINFAKSKIKKYKDVPNFVSKNKKAAEKIIEALNSSSHSSGEANYL